MTSKKGTDREHYIKNKFSTKDGWTCMRSYASLGPYDFIAFRRANCGGSLFGDYHTEMLMFQVKGTPQEFKEMHKQPLLDKAYLAGARPVLVYRENRISVLGAFTKNGKPRARNANGTLKIGKWTTVFLDTEKLPYVRPIKKKEKKIN